MQTTYEHGHWVMTVTPKYVSLADERDKSERRFRDVNACLNWLTAHEYEADAIALQEHHSRTAINQGPQAALQPVLSLKRGRGRPTKESATMDPTLHFKIETRGRTKRKPGPPGRKYEAVDLNPRVDKSPKRLDKFVQIQDPKSDKCRRVRVREPQRTAFRMVEIQGNYYRICSTSATKSQAMNFIKVYKNGDLVVIVPTTMCNPLNYIKKWPKSKWRRIVIDEIRNIGLTEYDAIRILEAPLIFV